MREPHFCAVIGYGHHAHGKTRAALRSMCRTSLLFILPFCSVYPCLSHLHSWQRHTFLFIVRSPIWHPSRLDSLLHSWSHPLYVQQQPGIAALPLPLSFRPPSAPQLGL